MIEKRKRLTVERVNKVLEDNNCTLRVLKIRQSERLITFNNGHAITTIGKYQSFRKNLTEHIAIFDMLYHIDSDIRERARRSLWIDVSGRPAWNKGIKTGQIPWNKGLKGWIVPWNKGLTGYKSTPCTEENKRRLSETRKGSGNPAFGKSPSKETREKQAKATRKSIENGSFTPKSNNSRTHFDSTADGKKFRSSWEAGFYVLNSTLDYERLRIPYKDEDQNDRIYITDFIDDENKILYEIKPKAGLNKFEFKKRGALQWCKENDYIFVIISEDWMYTNIENILEHSNRFDENTLRKLKDVKNKSDRKNRKT